MINIVSAKTKKYVNPIGVGSIGTIMYTVHDEKALLDNRHVLTTRTSNHFRQRTLELFVHQDNINYLKKLFLKLMMPGKLRDYILEHIDNDVIEFSKGSLSGVAGDLIDSDSISRRNYSGGGVTMWQEVKRLNVAFYYNRMNFVKDNRMLLENKSDNVIEDDNEDYAYRMFEADSLRPPGLENLNDPGPSWEILEDQYTRKPMYYKWQEMPSTCDKSSFCIKYDPKTNSIVPVKQSPPFKVEYFTQQNKTNQQEKKKIKKEGFNTDPEKVLPLSDNNGVYPKSGVDIEDMAWSVGNANRNPEQALSEYYGSDDCVSSDVIIDQTKLGYGGMAGNKTYGEYYSRGKDWIKNHGSKFQRYLHPPFWQDTSSRPYERDIDETLTSGILLEGNCQVRRFSDIERLRMPNGEQYRFNKAWHSGNV